MEKDVYYSRYRIGLNGLFHKRDRPSETFQTAYPFVFPIMDFRIMDLSSQYTREENIVFQMNMIV